MELPYKCFHKSLEFLVCFWCGSMKLAKHIKKGGCLTFDRRIGLINLSHNLGQGLHFFFLKDIHIPRDIRSEFVQFLTVSAASHPRSARPHRPTLPAPGGWHRTAHIAPAPVFPQPLASQFRNSPKLPDH